ncbi:MAG: hypothetical protein Q9168_006175 [Polycauliona sp. 1 TL-2023]
MPDLKGCMLQLQKPDGSKLGPPVKLSYKQMQVMSEIPVESLHIADEDGNLRVDTITIQEVKVKSEKVIDALFEAWTQLRSILMQHESALSRRWSNKKPQQRKALLHEAWPEMLPMHRPDFEVLRNKDRGKKSTTTTDFALRFPHMNVEDLSQKNFLPLMLDSRGRNSPATLTNADRDSLRVGIKSKLLVPKYIRGYTMLLNGEHTRETYGRLVSWKHDRQAFYKCQRGIAPDPGLGLLLLEIQRDVLKFLVRCAGLLLHDIPMAGLLNASIEATSNLQDLPSSQVKSASRSSTGDQESLTAHTLEGAYRAPDAFDFERLACLVEAKCHEVEDHFLLVREDPGYFADLLQEACGHTVEAVLNRSFDSNSPSLSEESWDNALCRVLMTAYHDVLIWECVSCLLDNLMNCYTKRKASIKLGQAFPEAYVQEFSRLAWFLECTIDGYLGALPEYMSAVPTFKKQIVNHPTSPGQFEISIAKKPDDYLFWLFTELLTGQLEKRRVCGLPNLFQEMESLITKDQKQKQRLSWRLIRTVSDLAVVAEIQRQMGLSTCSEHTFSAWSEEENLTWRNVRMAPLLEIREVFQAGTGLGSLVMDLRVFDYPSHKPRTASSTAKLRSAEDALDNLWQQIDQLFVCKTGKTLKSLEGKRINYCDVRRTPAWIEPTTSTECNSQVPENVDVALALATLELRTESTVDRSQQLAVREKTKTRNAAAFEGPANTLDANTDPLAATANISNPKLTVKKKAFNTFAALFGKLVGDTLPGELPWIDFMKAMVNIGFGAEKLQGSAWLFKAAEKSKFGSIIFHEPHPESKLPMQWARRIARRLNRNFGWTADTFVTE